MKILTFLVLIITLTACIENKNNSNLEDTTFSEVDTSKIAILSFDRFKDCFRVEEEAELNENDLVQIEIILQDVINNYNKKSNKAPLNLSTIKRQYIANETLDGEKEVWITCFCNDNSINWKKEVMIKKENDDCFFYLNINLTTFSHGDLIF